MIYIRKWQPTPVFLPGESQGQRSLVGWGLWGRTESDTTEVTQQQQQQHSCNEQCNRTKASREKRLKFPKILKMTTNYELNQKKKKISDLFGDFLLNKWQNKNIKPMFEVSGKMSKFVWMHVYFAESFHFRPGFKGFVNKKVTRSIQINNTNIY